MIVDRTQEVAGSSPASSVYERANAGVSFPGATKRSERGPSSSFDQVIPESLKAFGECRKRLPEETAIRPRYGGHRCRVAAHRRRKRANKTPRGGEVTTVQDERAHRTLDGRVRHDRGGHAAATAALDATLRRAGADGTRLTEEAARAGGRSGRTAPRLSPSRGRLAAMTDSPNERFAALAARFLEEPDVTEGTGFGKMTGLRRSGKIFAMLVEGRLVVKLPRERVDALVAAGVAERFDPGHGRVMKEWASVTPDASEEWDGLAGEAFAFVAGGPAPVRARTARVRKRNR